MIIQAGAFAQLLVAYDYTRLVVLAFPGILLTAEYFIRRHPNKFTLFSFSLILINFLILQCQYNFEGKIKMVSGRSKSTVNKTGKLSPKPVQQSLFLHP